MAAPSIPTRDVRRLARIQAISGLVFLGFVTLHLVNTMLAAYSAAAYDAYQRVLRPLYQFAPVEIGLVMVPLLVHIWAGIWTWRLRRPASAPVGLRARLHRASGIFLLAVIFGHIAAVRGSSLVLGIYPEFEGLTLTLYYAPWVFYPYYAVFALAALYHGSNGAFRALATLGVRVPPRLVSGWPFWAPIAAGGLLALAGILGIGGWLYPITDPPEVLATRFAEPMRLLRRLVGGAG